MVAKKMVNPEGNSEVTPWIYPVTCMEHETKKSYLLRSDAIIAARKPERFCETCATKLGRKKGATSVAPNGRPDVIVDNCFGCGMGLVNPLYLSHVDAPGERIPIGVCCRAERDGEYLTKARDPKLQKRIQERFKQLVAERKKAYVGPTKAELKRMRSRFLEPKASAQQYFS